MQYARYMTTRNHAQTSPQQSALNSSQRVSHLAPEIPIVRQDTPRSAAHTFIDLASNDYLGLARHPRVQTAAHQAIDQWGVGATGSRVVAGTVPPHHCCEAKLAGFLGFPAALLFSSGYLANLAAITALVPSGATLICDTRNHASLIDACRLTTAPRIICDVTKPPELAAALQQATSSVVVCDVVDSTDGSVLDIPSIYHATHAAGSLLIADFAHGLGVLGHDGRGALPALWTNGQAPTDLVITCTLSKALGSQGGAVLCSAEQRQHLVDTARSFIFDTALAPACAAAATTALEIIASEPTRVERLHQHMSALTNALDLPSVTAGVVAIPLGDPTRAIAVHRTVLSAGVGVGCFRPPSVPWQRSGLRLGGRADLSAEQLIRAITVLRDAL